MIKILKSREFTWFLLALPSLIMLINFLRGGVSVHGLLHPSGEFSARAMILSLYCSPLIALFPKNRLVRSLMKRRRYIGVAAFGYAVLHTALYLVDKGSLSAVLSEVLLLSIWTGWIAFLILVPLAATSNNWSVKRLGAKWKPLQKWVYLAAVLTAAHWLFLDYAIGPVLVHFLPLVVLQIMRIAKRHPRRQRLPA